MVIKTIMIKMKMIKTIMVKMIMIKMKMITIITGSASRGGEGLVRRLGEGNSPLKKLCSTISNQFAFLRTISTAAIEP